LRQSSPLAQFSSSIRKLTERTPIAELTASRAPLRLFRDATSLAEHIIARVAELPDQARVAVICADSNKAANWFNLMKEGLEGCFRNPILSERARLTERFKTHFTTPLDVKGLEFDAVVIPDVSEFQEDDPISMNGLYVAVSRPRYALLLGCNEDNSKKGIIELLIRMGHLIPNQ
jgi:DNA helicase IV